MASPLIQTNPNAPHTAVLWVKWEVHEKMASGELRNRPEPKGEKVFKIEGADRDICIRKLNDLLEHIKQC